MDNGDTNVFPLFLPLLLCSTLYTFCISAFTPHWMLILFISLIYEFLYYSWNQIYEWFLLLEWKKHFMITVTFGCRFSYILTCAQWNLNSYSSHIWTRNKTVLCLLWHYCVIIVMTLIITSTFYAANILWWRLFQSELTANSKRIQCELKANSKRIQCKLLKLQTAWENIY